MALFKTTDEIKNFLPVNLTFQFKDILPFLNEVERDYIIPAISQDQYNNLHTAYQTSSTDADQDALLAKIRVPLASFAYMLWIPWGQVQINSSGIQISVSENMKTAFAWQIENLERSASKSGFSGLEALLEFLETNKATYTLWAASDSYTESKEHFINTAKEFSDACDLKVTRRTYMLVKSMMSRLEKTVIKNTIGSDTYDSIKAQILSGSISSSNEELLDLIRPAVANLTLAKALTILSIQVDELGISVLSTPVTNASAKINTPANANHLSSLQKQCQTEGESFLQQLETKVNEDDEDYEEGFTNEDDWGAVFF